jgi:hypothetical protein
MNAFAAQRAVDFTYRLPAFGETLTEVVRAGLKDGAETDSVVGAGKDAHLSLLLDGKVFFEGNASGLTLDVAFKAAPAQKESNVWIVVPRSSPEFSSLAGGMTVGTAVQQLYIGGTITTLPPTTINGQPVFAVKESTKSDGFAITETVFIKATGAPLPVEVAQDIDGLSATILYGPWGKPPKVKPPKGAVPFQSSWVTKA